MAAAGEHLPGQHLPGQHLPGEHRMTHAEQIAHGGVPLPSTDPTLGNATNPYIAQEVQEGINSLREYMMSLGDFTTELRGIVTQIVALPDQIRSGGPGLGGLVGQAAEVARSMNQSVPPSQAAKAQAAAQVSTPEGAVPEAPRMTFSEGRNMSMSTAAQKAAGFMAGRLSQRESPWDPEPQMVDGSKAYVQRNSAGEIIRSVPFGPSEESEAMAAAVRDRGVARQAHLTSAVGALGRYAAGEGIAGALGGTALKLAGPVGLAVGAVTKGFDTYNDQLAAGGEFRQIYGEDAGRFAISQRAGRQMAGIEGFFSGTGRARAMEAYTAAAGMGLTGDRLEAATDFDRSMFMKQGMSTEDSMRFVKLNATNASISLSELSDEIDKVGKTAVEAGRNSSEAIKSFADINDLLQGNVAVGDTTGTAAAVQTALNRMPRNLGTPGAGAALVGSLTPNNERLQAVLAGQSPGAAVNASALGLSGANETLIASSAQNAVKMVCNTIGHTPESYRAEIQQKFSKDPSELSPSEQALALEPYQDAGGDAGTIQTIYQVNGINYGTNEVLGHFFNDLSVEGGVNTSLVQHPSLTKPLAGLEGALTNALGGKMAGGFSGLSGKSDTQKATALQTAVFGAMTPVPGGHAVNPAAQIPEGARSTWSAYTKFGEKSGDRNLAVEGLIKNAGDVSKAAGTDFDKATYSTSKGDKTLSQILGDPTLLAELGAGTVELNAKKGSKDIDIDIAKWTGIDSDSPMSSSDNKPDGKSVTGNGFTISLTNAAAKWFKITGPSDAQRAGTPAAATTGSSMGMQ